MQISNQRFSFLTALLLLVLGVTSPARADPQATDDPNTAGGPHGHGSRLNGHDSILIEAPIATSLPDNPAGSVPLSCYSITNSSDKSYFVPWNSPTEWSAFLTAIGAPAQLATIFHSTPQANTAWIGNMTVNTCCPEQQVGTLCNLEDGTPVNSSQELGTRYKGMSTGDVPFYGAQGDVMPVFAAQVNGDPNLTYRATFVCSNGAWVKTHEEGSCVPVQGKCATGSDGLTALPADLTTLCAKGSVFGGLSNSGGAASPGPWTWTCLGTPGQGDATCTSQESPTPGKCGPGNGIMTNTVPPVAQLCADGTTPSTVTAPNATDFDWTCSGINGSDVIASCMAHSTAGVCGSASEDWSNKGPKKNQLCWNGTPTAVVHGAGVNDDESLMTNGTLAWEWSCLDSNNFCQQGRDLGDGILADCECQEFDNAGAQFGTCGSSNASIVTSATIPPGNLCASGNTVDDTPVFVLDTPSYWTWSCQGAHDGTVAWCSAAYDPSPPNCGPANFGPPVQTPKSSDMCASGTAVGLTLTNAWWSWGCKNMSGTMDQCGEDAIVSGQCGNANGVSSSSAPTDLCGGGSNGSTPVNSDNTWRWSCTGANGGTAASCSAPVGTSNGNMVATCGSANGGTAASQPVNNLCANGSFATGVFDNGSGMWVWNCQSGSTTVICSAANTGTGPGICGSASGTAVDTIPNFNLCRSGGPGTVAGTGPWSWSCLGEGVNSGQNDSCAANFCNSCAGSVTTHFTSATTAGTMNGCAVKGFSSWTETDVIGQSSPNVIISWNDPFNGSFSRTVNAASMPATYCPPCYQTAQSVSNATVTVQATGSCSDPTLRSGDPVTFNATNVSVSPH